jgi:hypothetical protein
MHCCTYNTQVTGSCGKGALRNQVTEYRVDKLQLVYRGEGESSENLLSHTTDMHGLPVTYSTDRYHSSFDLGEWYVAGPRDVDGNSDDTATLKLQGLVFKQIDEDKWPSIPCNDVKVKLTHHTQTIGKFANVKIYKQHDEMSDVNTISKFGKAWLPLDDSLSVQPNNGDYLIRLSVANFHGEPVTDVDYTIMSMYRVGTGTKLTSKHWDKQDGHIWVLLSAAACLVERSGDGSYTVNLEVTIAS